MLSAEVAAAVDAWRPTGWSDADREALDALSDRVRRWVAAAAPQNATAARRLLLPTAALAVWAQRSLGTAEAATVFAPGTIEHWTMVVCADRPATWRQTARWALRHVGRAAHPAGRPPAPRRFGQRGVPAPYKAGEEAAYRLAVSLGPRRSDAGRGWVVCGALGAGLSGPELAAAETADLHDVADGRLAVRVRGPHARLVPIRADYADLARRVADNGPAGRLVTSSARNAVHRLIESVAPGGPGGLSLRRGRATWLCAHLAAGTPLVALRRIAGPLSANTLDGLLDRLAVSLSDAGAVTEGLRA